MEEENKPIEPNGGASPTGATVIPNSHVVSSDNFDGNTYDEAIQWLDKQIGGHQPMSAEDLKKLRRRQAAQRMMAGISDMGRAIANMYYTSQYAPNAYTENSGLSERLQARFDKEKADRDADDGRALNYVLTKHKLLTAKKDAERKEQQQNITLQLKMNEDARRQAKAEYDAQMADIDLQIKLGKLGYEEARQRQAAAKATLQEAYAAHADEIVMSEIGKNNRANTGSGRGGSSKPAEYVVQFPDGHTEKFHSEAAARNNAAARGGTYITTPTTSTNTTTSQDVYGPKTRTSTTTRDVSTPKVTVDWD